MGGNPKKWEKEAPHRIEQVGSRRASEPGTPGGWTQIHFSPWRWVCPLTGEMNELVFTTESQRSNIRLALRRGRPSHLPCASNPRRSKTRKRILSSTWILCSIQPICCHGRHTLSARPRVKWKPTCASPCHSPLSVLSEELQYHLDRPQLRRRNLSQHCEGLAEMLSCRVPHHNLRGQGVLRPRCGSGSEPSVHQRHPDARQDAQTRSQAQGPPPGAL